LRRAESSSFAVSYSPRGQILLRRKTQKMLGA
jgi:hypothetical protein